MVEKSNMLKHLKKFIKAKNGFSLVELMLLLLILSLFTAAAMPIVTKRAQKIPKTATTHGEYRCYWEDDQLIGKRFDENGNIIRTEFFDSGSCEFKKPGGELSFDVYMIGGGGGGGNSFEKPSKSQVTSSLGEKHPWEVASSDLSTNVFGEDGTDLGDRFKNIFNDIYVFVCNKGANQVNKNGKTSYGGFVCVNPQPIDVDMAGSGSAYTDGNTHYAVFQEITAHTYNGELNVNNGQPVADNPRSCGGTYTVCNQKPTNTHIKLNLPNSGELNNVKNNAQFTTNYTCFSDPSLVRGFYSSLDDDCKKKDFRAKISVTRHKDKVKYDYSTHGAAGIFRHVGPKNFNQATIYLHPGKGGSAGEPGNASVIIDGAVTNQAVGGASGNTSEKPVEINLPECSENCIYDISEQSPYSLKIAKTDPETSEIFDKNILKKYGTGGKGGYYIDNCFAGDDYLKVKKGKETSNYTDSYFHYTDPLKRSCNPEDNNYTKVEPQPGGNGIIIIKW